MAQLSLLLIPCSGRVLLGYMCRQQQNVFLVNKLSGKDMNIVFPQVLRSFLTIHSQVAVIGKSVFVLPCQVAFMGLHYTLSSMQTQGSQVELEVVSNLDGSTYTISAQQSALSAPLQEEKHEDAISFCAAW